MVKTLAIETSCDDTSVGIVNFDGEVFFVDALLAYSQIQDHQQYGGVVPEIASRLHSDKIIEVIKTIGLDVVKDVDVISVTTHPGLPGSLVVGKAVASLLSAYISKPLVQVNHIYAHIFSLLLERKISDIQFPMVVLTASGGHNDIYVVNSTNSEQLTTNNDGISFHEFGGYKIAKIGYTLDDAAGECFDKVARMLGGPYPGGQRISERASLSQKSVMSKVESQNPVKSKKTKDADFMDFETFDLKDFHFKRIFLSKDNFEFSFSGMKSQVSFLLKKLVEGGRCKVEGSKIEVPEELVCDIAYEFQEAVVEVLVKKLVRAGIAFGAKTLGLAGGVSCNDRLWDYLNEYANMQTLKHGNIETFSILRPTKKVYSTDNAAMIGLAGILDYNAKY